MAAGQNQKADACVYALLVNLGPVGGDDDHLLGLVLFQLVHKAFSRRRAYQNAGLKKFRLVLEDNRLRLHRFHYKVYACRHRSFLFGVHQKQNVFGKLVVVQEALVVALVVNDGKHLVLRAVDFF